MWVLFALFWGIVGTLTQINIKPHWGIFSLTINFVPILVIYMSFTFPFFRGFVALFLVGYFFETFSLAPHGSFIVAILVLYISIRLIANRIFTEAYLTKALWLMPLSIYGQVLILISLRDLSALSFGPAFWTQLIIQGVFDALVGFVIFISLDRSLEAWMSRLHRQRSHLKGADFYELQSEQRKFF